MSTSHPESRSPCGAATERSCRCYGRLGRRKLPRPGRFGLPAGSCNQKLTLVTYDRRTIPPLLKDWAEEGRPHAGVIFVDEKDHLPRRHRRFGSIPGSLDERSMRLGLDQQNLFLTPSRNRVPQGRLNFSPGRSPGLGGTLEKSRRDALRNVERRARLRRTEKALIRDCFLPIRERDSSFIPHVFLITQAAT